MFESGRAKVCIVFCHSPALEDMITTYSGYVALVTVQVAAAVEECEVVFSKCAVSSAAVGKSGVLCSATS